MTTKMRRCLKINENRPNYAKRAKDFGLEYISIRNIQKYFEKDWEEQIESSEQRFTWKYITKYLIRKDAFEMCHTQFDDFINELLAEGLPFKEKRWLRRKHFFISHSRNVRGRRHIKRIRDNFKLQTCIPLKLFKQI